ncbi:hypothetical protein R6Q59_034816 [Mikania micrantha]
MFTGEREQDRRGCGWSHVTEFKSTGAGVSVSGETRAFGVLPAATADGYVTEGAAVGPVAAAGLAEMTRLGEVVVVVVAEFGVGGVATGAGEVFWLWRWCGVVGLGGGGSTVIGGIR